MTSSAPVTGGPKALAVITIVFGSLVFLTSLLGIGGAAYLLATGHSLGQEQVRKVMSSVSGEQGQMVKDYDAEVQRQIDRQKAVAPIQIGIFVPYAAAIAICVIISALLLAGRGSKAWLARAALAGCLLRFGVAGVEYRLTAPLSDSMKMGWDRGIERGSKGRPTPEGLKEMGSAFASIGHTLVIASVMGQALVVGGYWGLVAYVFSRKTRPAPAPLPSP